MAVDDQALLGQPQDPAIHNMMVQGLLSREGDRYVSDSGQTLDGTPDANGMMSMPVFADGTYAGQPQAYSFGPGYDDAPTNFTGTPFAPQVFDGSSGGPAPAGAVNYDTSSQPTNWQDFSGKGTSTGGGFWNFDQVYGSQGKDVPHTFQNGSNLPSTNNYRLLPTAYQKPNYIMRNGQIIDTNSYLTGPPQTQGTATNPGPHWGSGAAFGYPAGWLSSQDGWGTFGWPGQLGQYGYLPPGN